jgi:hypothetical protein
MKEKELHSSLQSSGTEISWMVRIHAGQKTGGSVAYYCTECTFYFR